MIGYEYRGTLPHIKVMVGDHFKLTDVKKTVLRRRRSKVWR